MKPFYILFITLSLCHFSNAQQSANTDAKITEDENPATSGDTVPEYPGGISAFVKYISQNLKYPDVARLIGISGKLYVSFIIERDGRVTNVTPKNCIGAGCEAEATRLLETSPAWKPGIQNNRPVRVLFNVPIAFVIDGGKVYLKKLKSSGYGFVFSIKDSLYTIDEAEKILGKSFMSNQVEIAEPFFNYNKVEKFEMPDKKEVYLLIFKST
jgi:protein TonB